MACLVPLTIMRQTVGRIFSDSVTVTPPTVAKNARGGEGKTYNSGDAVTYSKCLLSPAGKGQYQQFAGTIKPGTLFTLRFEHAVEIDPEAKIVCNGFEYQLMAPSPEASYALTETFMVVLKP